MLTDADFNAASPSNVALQSLTVLSNSSATEHHSSASTTTSIATAAALSSPLTSSSHGPSLSAPSIPTSTLISTNGKERRILFPKAAARMETAEVPRQLESTNVGQASSMSSSTFAQASSILSPIMPPSSQSHASHSLEPVANSLILQSTELSSDSSDVNKSRGTGRQSSLRNDVLLPQIVDKEELGPREGNRKRVRSRSRSVSPQSFKHRARDGKDQASSHRLHRSPSEEHDSRRRIVESRTTSSSREIDATSFKRVSDGQPTPNRDNSTAHEVIDRRAASRLDGGRASSGVTIDDRQRRGSHSTGFSPEPRSSMPHHRRSKHSRSPERGHDSSRERVSYERLRSPESSSQDRHKRGRSRETRERDRERDRDKDIRSVREERESQKRLKERDDRVDRDDRKRDERSSREGREDAKRFREERDRSSDKRVGLESTRDDRRSVEDRSRRDSSRDRHDSSRERRPHHGESRDDRGRDRADRDRADDRRSRDRVRDRDSSASAVLTRSPSPDRSRSSASAASSSPSEKLKACAQFVETGTCSHGDACNQLQARSQRDVFSFPRSSGSDELDRHHQRSRSRSPSSLYSFVNGSSRSHALNPSTHQTYVPSPKRHRSDNLSSLSSDPVKPRMAPTTQQSSLLLDPILSIGTKASPESKVDVDQVLAISSRAEDDAFELMDAPPTP